MGGGRGGGVGVACVKEKRDQLVVGAAGVEGLRVGAAPLAPSARCAFCSNGCGPHAGRDGHAQEGSV